MEKQKVSSPQPQHQLQLGESALMQTKPWLYKTELLRQIGSKSIQSTWVETANVRLPFGTVLSSLSMGVIRCRSEATEVSQENSISDDLEDSCPCFEVLLKSPKEKFTSFIWLYFTSDHPTYTFRI